MIYFITEVDSKNRIKIGYSKTPSNRLRVLQTGSPEKLAILNVIDGGLDKEKEIHNKFAHLHVNGEWFRNTKELYDFIYSHPEHYLAGFTAQNIEDQFPNYSSCVGDPPEALKKLYDSDNQLEQKIGALLNRILENEEKEFEMSRPKLMEIIIKDEHLSYTSINYRSYNKLLDHAKNVLGYIEELRKPKKGLCGLYRVTDKFYNENSTSIKKNKYESFVKESLTNKNSVKLSEVSLVSELDKEMQLALNALYNNADPQKKRIGSILNSIFTQESHVFMNSVRILDDLVNKDPNTTLKSCHSSKYNEIMHLLQKNGIILKIREPKGRRAGLYKLIADIYLNILIMVMGKEMLDAKEKANIEWYDKNSDINNNDPISEDPELDAIMDEIWSDEVIND